LNPHSLAANSPSNCRVCHSAILARSFFILLYPPRFVKIKLSEAPEPGQRCPRLSTRKKNRAVISGAAGLC